MNEKLTIEEMEARFPREWVLITEPVKDEYRGVTAGLVAFHSKDRDEVDRKLLELRPSHFAVYYLGRIPEEGLELLL